MDIKKSTKTVWAKLPTRYGNFEITVFKAKDGRLQTVLKSCKKFSTPLVRLHSKCLTGDTFWSCRCDCGEQLAKSLKLIAQKGGLLLYLNQEGRDIGLENKIKAYALQDQGEDTIQANLDLKLPVDARDYRAAVAILKALNIPTINLLTNNPEKIVQLKKGGIEIKKIIRLEVAPNRFNKFYLQTKKNKMGHNLKLV